MRDVKAIVAALFSVIAVGLSLIHIGTGIEKHDFNSALPYIAAALCGLAYLLVH